MDGKNSQQNVEQEHLETRVNGLVTTEAKIYPHPVTIETTGLRPFLFQQPPIPFHPLQLGMSGIQAPYLTQASLFYTPQFIPTQQLTFSQQQLAERGGVIRQITPLLQMNVGVMERATPTTAQLSSQELYRQEDRKERFSQHSEQLSPESEGDITSPEQRSRISQSSNDERDFDMKGSPSSQTMSLSGDSLPGTPMSASSPQAAVNPTSPETPFSVKSPPSIVNELCGICSDRATGHHYGVTSCEGCKGFFKRSVQNKKMYTCRNLTKDCPIDKRHRNRCQYCRFQKCIQAGMMKEAVREDRTPGGKHKATLHKVKFKQEHTSAKQPRLSSTSSSCSSVCSPTMPSSPSPLPEFIKQILEFNVDETDNCDTCPGCIEEELKEKTLAHVTQLAEQQIVRSSVWFKKLSLLKEICKEDQKTLMANVWVELMLVNLIRNSLSLENKALLCKGQILDFETAEATGIGDIMKRVVQMASKFRELKLGTVEFVYMKIIILLNPDVSGLRNYALVEQLQDKVHSALQEYIKEQFPNEPNRFGNILLRLPELRSIGTKSIERLFMLNLTGQIHPSLPLYDLLHSAKR